MYVSSSLAHVPHSDGESQHTLNCGVIVGDQQPLLQSVSPEESQEVETLLGFLDHFVGVGCPFEVLRDVGSEEFE